MYLSPSAPGLRMATSPDIASMLVPPSTVIAAALRNSSHVESVRFSLSAPDPSGLIRNLYPYYVLEKDTNVEDEFLYLGRKIG